MLLEGLFLLLLVCILAVGLFFLDKAAARRGVKGWMFFGRWVLFYGVIATYLGFIFAGLGRYTVSGELLLKGALFSCIFAAVLGLLHGGVKSLPVAWAGFVKVLLFCGLMGGILGLFVVGVKNIDSIRVMFLKALVLALLLKLLLSFFIRAQSDTLVQRVLRVLNFLLFICILALVFNFVQWGAERLGWSWLWFSNQNVLIFISGFLFPLIWQGMKSARVMGKAFFKRVGF
ncbi:hypothetical protein [Bartonella krasnovii]|uniref:hypothetical protein n=1 Tax=Bartonella krasnovii TaxID=2267275 RepID=UPI001F4C8216|nr:hypothetical protein [Bartonella krasnovii]UNF39780.1 hypothetical protein MNL10_07270 [Bartonella krasnovii]UNF50059.1 hypothetical protein MNL03_07215 [Bartonella krasnovii]